MRLKKKELEGKIGSKIVKVGLKYFGLAFLKEDLDFYLSTKLKDLFDEFEDGLTVEDDHHAFIDRFRKDWSFISLIDRLFFMLERGKKYKLCALSLVVLLKNKLCYSKRGSWWHRLAMNLKHLKMKKEALTACDLALKDAFVKDEKRNMILKLRLGLFAELNK